VRLVEQEQHLQLLAQASLTLVAVVAAQHGQVQTPEVLAVLAVLEAAAMVQTLLGQVHLEQQPLELQTRVAVVVAHLHTAQAQQVVKRVVLVLSSCLSPQTNIRELLRVHRRSQQAGQTPF
jgi:hypothetical protein